MRINRFYCNKIENSQKSIIDLNEESSHYIKNVLRLSKNDSLCLFDGTGIEYQGIIQEISRKAVTISILHQITVSRESKAIIHLGQVISRSDRMDFSIQKSVELGVTEITPIITQYTKLNKNQYLKKQNHWENIIISACEQSGRTILPRLNPILSLQEWLSENQSETKIILHPRNGKKLSNIELSNSCSVLVGCEGGFTDEEVNQSEKCGFQSIHLGQRILRTETACTAILAILQNRIGDL